MKWTTREVAELLNAQPLPCPEPCIWAFRAKCPAHADSTPSLTITGALDELPNVYCHAGCSKEAIWNAIFELKTKPQLSDQPTAKEHIQAGEDILKKALAKQTIGVPLDVLLTLVNTAKRAQRTDESLIRIVDSITDLEAHRQSSGQAKVIGKPEPTSGLTNKVPASCTVTERSTPLAFVHECMIPLDHNGGSTCLTTYATYVAWSPDDAPICSRSEFDAILCDAGHQIGRYLHVEPFWVNLHLKSEVQLPTPDAERPTPTEAKDASIEEALTKSVDQEESPNAQRPTPSAPTAPNVDSLEEAKSQCPAEYARVAQQLRNAPYLTLAPILRGTHFSQKIVEAIRNEISGELRTDFIPLAPNEIPTSTRQAEAEEYAVELMQRGGGYSNEIISRHTGLSFNKLAEIRMTLRRGKTAAVETQAIRPPLIKDPDLLKADYEDRKDKARELFRKGYQLEEVMEHCDLTKQEANGVRQWIIRHSRKQEAAK